MSKYGISQLKEFLKVPFSKSRKHPESTGANVHSHIAASLERDTQFQKYHNERAGLGWAAEDANALNDRLAGRTVDKVGLTNELNGPDRIVDGIPVQTKYYNTPKNTIEAAFDKLSGQYRYCGQELEVPADQYDECLRLMKNKISQGLVKDAAGKPVTKVEEAKKYLRKGSVTFQQAKNIAKAGNIDSLVFDAKNNIISTGHIGGISFVVSFARYKWEGATTPDALKLALDDALRAGSIAMLSGILSSQMMRSSSASGMTVLVRPGVRSFYHSSEFGKLAVEKLASAAAGKTVSGAAAINSASKLLRSNVITSCVSTVVITAPDFYRAAIAKNISWAQFGKNLTVNAAGVAGGIGGWAGGAAAGAAIGTLIPGIGNAVGATIGGVVGAVAGGALSSKGAKAGLDRFVKDDADAMLELVTPIVEQLCFDYLLSEKEVRTVINHIKNKITAKWLRAMYGAGDDSKRSRWARDELEPVFENLIRERDFIDLPQEDFMETVVAELVETVSK